MQHARDPMHQRFCVDALEYALRQSKTLLEINVVARDGDWRDWVRRPLIQQQEHRD